MPKTGGVIPRKILPIFAVVQEFGDARDDIYHSIINELLKKYWTINEINADVEVFASVLKISLDGIYSTNSLSNSADFLDEHNLNKMEELGGTFTSALEVLSGELSVQGFLSAEVGYYEPIVFFFIDDLEIDNSYVQKIKSENKWFQCSTKIAIPFSDCPDKFKVLLGTREAVFAVSKDFDQKKIDELVNVIYDIRINSITNSIQANFSQTGDICAAMFRGAIDEPDEYDDSLFNFYEKQRRFKTLVAVDPLEECGTVDSEHIVTADAIETREEQGDGNDSVNLDNEGALNSDALASGSCDD